METQKIDEPKVELIGFYGGDKRHALSAWQSTTQELGIDIPDTIEDRIDVIFNYLAKQKKKSPEDLLDFLASHGHETPFEKSSLDFQVTADIATHIHFLKHRIGVAINGESARYKEFKSDKYYIPKGFENIKLERKFNINGKTPENLAELLEEVTLLNYDAYHYACSVLSNHTKRKRAKEVSRYFLGYNTIINFDAMFNFRSFVHFQRLRNSQHAQVEVSKAAQNMLDLVKAIPGQPFQQSLDAFKL
jgi:flavin-dependent thymidylate synthase